MRVANTAVETDTIKLQCPQGMALSSYVQHILQSFRGTSPGYTFTTTKLADDIAISWKYKLPDKPIAVLPTPRVTNH